MEPASPSIVDAAASGRPNSRSPVQIALRRLLRNPMGLIGGTVLFLLCAAAVFAPWVAPHDPLLQYAGEELVPPGGVYLLGTDQLGRDLLSRIIYGGRTTQVVGVLAAVFGAGLGVMTGLAAGYFGGALDAAIMRTYDGLLAFPTILLGVAVVTALGPGELNISYAIGVAQVPHFARITRACVLTESQRDYVLASRSLGATSSRIMLRHVLPNCLSPLLVQLTLTMAFAVLAEASLSFLGLGAQPPTPSWGAMLSDSRAFLRDAPWMAVWPGLALALLLIGLNFFQDALRDTLDPRHVGDS